MIILKAIKRDRLTIFVMNQNYCMLIMCMLGKNGSVCFAMNKFFFLSLFQNPGYMKENFFISIETMHAPDKGTQENVSCRFFVND